MTKPEDLEVYRQRYETYRHLDRLRWQMFQIAIAAGSVILAFGNRRSDEPEWWVLLIVGVVLVALGFAMERIRHGINANGSALRSVGKSIGDINIPPLTDFYCSVAFWIATAIILLGVTCMTLALYMHDINLVEAKMHKAFISYHHALDQEYKDLLCGINDSRQFFIDMSVDTGDISDDLTDQVIREKIRDEYLRDSTVTIVLVGLQTKRRKHVDWEIYSSMFDGTVNKKSGILVIDLPSTGSTTPIASHDGETKSIYPDIYNWHSISDKPKAYFDNNFPHLPERITDSLPRSNVKISVTPWDTIARDPGKLAWLLDATFNDRAACDYNLSNPMRRSNS